MTMSGLGVPAVTAYVIVAPSRLTPAASPVDVHVVATQPAAGIA